MNNPTRLEPAFLRLPQVLNLISVSKSTWWAWVASNKAPKPIKLSERITVWRAADIDAFIAEQSGEAQK